MTLTEIARQVGVDVSLVSRVLRGDAAGRISEAKRDLILRIADENGYRPNRIGRSLRTGRANIIGVMTPDITNPFHSALFRGVERVAMAAGYDTILCNTDDDPARCRELISVLVNGHIDGLIVGSARADDKSVEWLRGTKLPYLLVNRRTDDGEDPWVGPDDFEAGRLGAAHLAALGHRRIAFLIQDLGIWNHRQRLAGFLAGLAEAGIEQDAVEIATELDSRAAAKAHVAGLLRRPARRRPTALFAPQTIVSQAATAALLGTRLRAPDDISVIGFTTLEDPDITSIRPPNIQMGAMAAEKLLDALKDPKKTLGGFALKLPVQLIDRGSTGPVPGGRSKGS